jgi:uncharacterized protein YukE
MNPSEVYDGQPRKPLPDDREIIEDLIQMVPSDGIIEFLRTFSFGNAYRGDFMDPLYAFIDLRGGPEYEFIDIELEKLRKDLRAAIQAFLSLLHKNTFRQQGIGGDHTLSRIPDEWEMTQGRRYHQAITDLNAAAGEVCKTYDDLVRNARAKLQTKSEIAPFVKSDNRVDRIVSWAKNNLLGSVLIVFLTVIAGAAALLTNISSILDHFQSEHTVVIVTKLSSEDVGYDGVIVKDKVIVQFEPKDSRQRFQQIILELPALEDQSAKRRTVAPPFKTNLGFELLALNGVLQQAIPKRELEDPYHIWLCADSVPIVLNVDYFTSSGESRTEKMLYDMDFTYGVYERCGKTGNCLRDRWSVSLMNIRFLRRLGANDNPQSILNAELAHKNFKFEPGY